MNLSGTDITLVPWSDLPLQTTLNFIPCPSDLATSYLQASCLSENFMLNRETILRLYTGSSSSADNHLHRDACLLDLRFAINQLQYWSFLDPTIPSKPTADSTTNTAEAHSSFTIHGDLSTVPENSARRHKKQCPGLAFYDTMSYAEDKLSRAPSYLATVSADWIATELQTL